MILCMCKQKKPKSVCGHVIHMSLFMQRGPDLDHIAVLLCHNRCMQNNLEGFLYTNTEEVWTLPHHAPVLP